MLCFPAWGIIVSMYKWADTPLRNIHTCDMQCCKSTHELRGGVVGVKEGGGHRHGRVSNKMYLKAHQFCPVWTSGLWWAQAGVSRGFPALMARLSLAAVGLLLLLVLALVSTSPWGYTETSPWLCAGRVEACCWLKGIKSFIWLDCIWMLLIADHDKANWWIIILDRITKAAAGL